jgi:anthranilate synthase/aminodeoxychorismate synthase-like glutamine amidotransferase
MTDNASPQIFMLDNYDSFTYNLVQYLEELGAIVTVERNDTVTPKAVLGEEYDGIVISPGPGRPEDAGITTTLIQEGAGRLPILGVCLGHQAIGSVFGARVVQAKRLMHGKVSPINHNNQDLFQGMENPFQATRYHSLTLEGSTVQSPLKVTAWADEDEIMGIAHESFPLWGFQFHPESILTPEGKLLLANFLRVCSKD